MDLANARFPRREPHPVVQALGTLIQRHGRVLAMVALAMALLGGIALIGAKRQAEKPGSPAQQARALPKGRVIPRTELPSVEAPELREITPETAVAINEAVPFSKLPNPAARPFVLAGGDADLQRAIDCLAFAELYEAGDDVVGERAVAQVVLNRLRHPAFPKTVCGVVFQGAERKTGCQFTFTCDGALARVPRLEALERARDVARQALKGKVARGVGYATHYHTNWVVPYWSASLDKNAQVGTHLFFRWSGWWGTPPAFGGRYAGSEPLVAQLAAYSPAHKAGDAAAVEAVAGASLVSAATVALPVTSAAGFDESTLRFTPTAKDANIFLVTLPAGLSASRYPAIAAATCGDRPRCLFMGWADAAQTPAGLPAGTSQLQSMAFHFVRDPALSAPRARWNCALTPQDDKQRCLSHQAG